LWFFLFKINPLLETIRVEQVMLVATEDRYLARSDKIDLANGAFLLLVKLERLH